MATLRRQYHLCTISLPLTRVKINIKTITPHHRRFNVLSLNIENFWNAQ